MDDLGVPLFQETSKWMLQAIGYLLVHSRNRKKVRSVHLVKWGDPPVYIVGGLTHLLEWITK